jgi:hypothetical protein
MRALRAHDQKSNRPKTQNPNNFHAKSPAISALIKTRCAKMLTKAHHRASLTEEDKMRLERTAPPIPVGAQSLCASASLRCDPLPPPPVCQISKRTHRVVPNWHTREPAALQSAPSHANFAKRSHRPSLAPARTCHNLPKPATAAPWQNEPTTGYVSSRARSSPAWKPARWRRAICSCADPAARWTRAQAP